MSEDVTTEEVTTDEEDSAPPASETERRQLHDMWAAGTEEPDWVVASTSEGAQLMLPRDQASPVPHQSFFFPLENAFADFDVLSPPPQPEEEVGVLIFDENPR